MLYTKIASCHTSSIAARSAASCGFAAGTVVLSDGIGSVASGGTVTLNDDDSGELDVEDGGSPPPGNDVEEVVADSDVTAIELGLLVLVGASPPEVQPARTSAAAAASTPMLRTRRPTLTSPEQPRPEPVES